MNTVSLNSPEIENYLAAVLGARVENYADASYLSSVGVDATIADKLIRVFSTQTDKPRNDEKPQTRSQIHSFIAVKDFETRALGKVSAGDILKPASYKAPAKHARGNLFAADGGIECVNHYGPEYLR